MSLDVQIRWAIKRDLPDLLAIDWGSFDRPLNADQFMDLLKKRTCIGMVAETDDRSLAGYMIYFLHKGSLHLERFAVAAWARRQGVGKYMVKRLTDKLSDQRRREITLEIPESNLEAQLFFRECGFRAVEVFPQWYPSTNEDAFFFVYKLRGWSEPLPKFQWRNRIGNLV